MRYRDTHERAKHALAIVVNPMQHMDDQRHMVFLQADPATCSEDGSPICLWSPPTGLPIEKAQPVSPPLLHNVGYHIQAATLAARSARTPP